MSCSSVDSFAPSIMLPKYTINAFINLKFELRHIEKTAINRKEAGIGPFKKTIFRAVVVVEYSLMQPSK